MSTRVPSALRRQVLELANFCCEYCHFPEDLSISPHEADHIIAEKHLGKTILHNLACACLECNRHKGSNIASIDPENGSLTPLFNPRSQLWIEHFRWDDGIIVPLTAIGRVTVHVLELNAPDRVEERSIWMSLNQYFL